MTPSCEEIKLYLKDECHPWHLLNIFKFCVHKSLWSESIWTTRSFSRSESALVFLLCSGKIPFPAWSGTFEVIGGDGLFRVGKSLNSLQNFKRSLYWFLLIQTHLNFFTLSTCRDPTLTTTESSCENSTWKTNHNTWDFCESLEFVNKKGYGLFRFLNYWKTEN